MVAVVIHRQGMIMAMFYFGMLENLFRYVFCFELERRLGNAVLNRGVPYHDGNCGSRDGRKIKSRRMTYPGHGRTMSTGSQSSNESEGPVGLCQIIERNRLSFRSINGFVKRILERLGWYFPEEKRDGVYSDEVNNASQRIYVEVALNPNDKNGDLTVESNNCDVEKEEGNCADGSNHVRNTSTDSQFSEPEEHSVTSNQTGKFSTTSLPDSILNGEMNEQPQGGRESGFGSSFSESSQEEGNDETNKPPETILQEPDKHSRKKSEVSLGSVPGEELNEGNRKDSGLGRSFSGSTQEEGNDETNKLPEKIFQEPDEHSREKSEVRLEPVPEEELNGGNRKDSGTGESVGDISQLSAAEFEAWVDAQLDMYYQKDNGDPLCSDVNNNITMINREKIYAAGDEYWNVVNYLYWGLNESSPRVAKQQKKTPCPLSHKIRQAQERHVYKLLCGLAKIIWDMNKGQCRVGSFERSATEGCKRCMTEEEHKQANFLRRLMFLLRKYERLMRKMIAGKVDITIKKRWLGKYGRCIYSNEGSPAAYLERLFYAHVKRIVQRGISAAPLGCGDYEVLCWILNELGFKLDPEESNHEYDQTRERSNSVLLVASMWGM